MAPRARARETAAATWPPGNADRSSCTPDDSRPRESAGDGDRRMAPVRRGQRARHSLLIGQGPLRSQLAGSRRRRVRSAFPALSEFARGRRRSARGERRVSVSKPSRDIRTRGAGSARLRNTRHRRRSWWRRRAGAPLEWRSSVPRRRIGVARRRAATLPSAAQPEELGGRGPSLRRTANTDGAACFDHIFSVYRRILDA